MKIFKSVLIYLTLCTVKCNEIEEPQLDLGGDEWKTYDCNPDWPVCKYSDTCIKRVVTQILDENDIGFMSNKVLDPTLCIGCAKYFCVSDFWLWASIQYQDIMVPGIGYAAKLCVVDPPLIE